MQGQEFDTSPSHDLAGAYDGNQPLSASILNTKLDALRADKLRLTEERAALSELARLRHTLQRSRWVALGALLGRTRDLQRLEGKTPTQKLKLLKEACARSKWLSFGSIIGSSAAKITDPTDEP